MGPLVTGLEIRKATQERLEEWLPAYLAEIGRRFELELRDPRSWTRLPKFRDLRADQSPSIVVTSPGLAGPPERDGDGAYFALWNLNVFIVVRGKSFEETADLVALYVAAVRATIAQQGIPIESARKPRWNGEGYDEIARNATRTIGAGVASFIVPIGDVLDDDAGPTELPEPPDYEFPDDTFVEEAFVEVDQIDEVP
jgi:hypothetical protein